MRIHVKLAARVACIHLLLIASTIANPASNAMLLGQSSDGPVHFRAGAVLGAARTSFGCCERSTEVGPLLSGQLGVAVMSSMDVTLGLIVQPFKAENPIREEAFTAIYSLLGLQLGLAKQGRLYLRPEFGLGFLSWSGPEVFFNSETRLTAGLAFGRDWSLGKKMALGLEASARFLQREDVRTILVGLGLSFVPLGANRHLKNP